MGCFLMASKDFNFFVGYFLMFLDIDLFWIFVLSSFLNSVRRYTRALILVLSREGGLVDIYH